MTKPSEAAVEDGGRLLAGRYELLAPIGQGGMGSVWRARDLRTDRQVAIKRLRQPSADANRRFVREARALARLRHPHLVDVLDGGSDDAGSPYLVMELVPGVTLANELDRLGPLDIERSCEIAAQIAAGLAAAHAQGVVHRDLKPSNIMLSNSQVERDFVRLIDFGVAQFRDGSATALTGSQFVGTPQYASPEQAHGAPSTQSSDLYSLGVVMFQMLTGQHPFAAETPMGFLYHHVHSAAPRAALSRPEVPGWLDDLVAALLEKQATDRPESSQQVLDSLRGRRALAGRVAPFRAVSAPGAPPLADSTVNTASSPRAPRAKRAGSDGPSTWRRRRRLALAALGSCVAVFGFAHWVLRNPGAGGLWTESTSQVEPGGASVRGSSEPAALTPLTQLTDGSIVMATLSPSGTQLAYIEARGAMLLDIATGARRPLALEPDQRVLCLAWYPDERRLLLTTAESGSKLRALRTFDLDSASLLPSSAESLTISGVSGSCPELSPDARRVQFWEGDWAHPRLKVIETQNAGHAARQARAIGQRLDIDDGRATSDLQWSPDGEWLAFRSSIQQQATGTLRSEIVAVHVASGVERRLLSAEALPGAAPGEPAPAVFLWLPSWELLYVREPADGSAERASLWSLAIDRTTLAPLGAPRRRLTLAQSNVRALSADRAGKRLALIVETQSDAIYTAELAGRLHASSPLARLTRTLESESVEDWLDDDTLIVSTGRQPAGRLTLHSLTSGAVRPWPGPASVSPRVFGSHRLLSYRAGVAGPWLGSLTQVQLDPAVERTILTLPAQGLAEDDTRRAEGPLLECSREASRCAWAWRSDRELAWNVLDVDTGERIDAVPTGAVGLRSLGLSKDGRFLAFTAQPFDSEQVHFSGVGSGSTMSVSLPPGCVAQALAFDVASSGVYVTSVCVGELPYWADGYAPYRVFHVPMTGSVTQVSARDHSWFREVAVSPGGQRLALGVTTLDRNAWLLTMYPEGSR